MKLNQMDNLVIQAQQKKLKTHQAELLAAKNQKEVELAFVRINRTARFLRYLRSQGFCRWEVR